MKKVISLLVVISFCLPVFTQTKNEEGATDEVINGNVYKEITLENFEETEFTKKNGTLRVTKDQKYDVMIRNDYPAPIKDTTKYLGIKLYGKKGDPLVIKPTKKLLIKDHAQSISLWVYGKNFAGELSIFLTDANGKGHRLSMGKLNYLGWRKLTIRLRKDIRQEDKFLAQPRNLEILQIIYTPGNTGRLPQWHYFYIDDITAKVRKKYEDKQSDTW